MKTKITNPNESLEWNAGYEYAEAMHPDGEPVDINQMLMGSCDMPSGDYDALVDEGVENPNARDYWTGFNAYYKEKLRKILYSVLAEDRIENCEISEEENIESAVDCILDIFWGE